MSSTKESFNFCLEHDSCAVIFNMEGDGVTSTLSVVRLPDT